MCSHGLLKQIRIKKDATKSHNHEKSAHCDNARQIQTLQAPVENIYGYCRQPMFSVTNQMLHCSPYLIT